jgi:hypothetical protein
VTRPPMDPGDLLRIAATYADIGYAGGVDAALDATGDVLSAAYGAGYEVTRRPATRQQEPGVPPLPDQFAERLDTMAAEASNSTTTGDLPPDVLARWAGVSRGEAIRQVEHLRERVTEAARSVAALRVNLNEAERDRAIKERDEADRALRRQRDKADRALRLALDQRDEAVAALEAREEAMRQEASLFQKRISEADAKVARLTVSLNMANERRRQERDEAVSLGGALIAAEAARDAAYAAIRAAVTLRKWPLRFPSGVWVWSGGWETAPMDVQHRAAVNAAVERGPAGEPDPLRGERG